MSVCLRHQKRNMTLILSWAGSSCPEVPGPAGAGAAATHRGAQEQGHGQEAAGGGQEARDREGGAGEAGGHYLSE